MAKETKMQTVYVVIGGIHYESEQAGTIQLFLYEADALAYGESLKDRSLGIYSDYFVIQERRIQ
jgi:hypothetical protein